MYELALFAGAGGGLLATTHLLKWHTICYVEWNKYCVEIIRQRIKDGYLHNAPIWDDAQTFDGTPWAGCVDIITAGFPCQPFSTAGKQKGASDKRNMWPSTIRIIREVQPTWVLLENVPGLLSAMDKSSTFPHSYFGTVLGDLAQSGYNARWRVLSAAEVGAPHRRDRVFVVAYSSCDRMQYGSTQANKGTTRENALPRMGSGRSNIRRSKYQTRNLAHCPSKATSCLRWGQIEPPISRVVDGLAHRVDRLKAVGNGQVPAVVATVWQLLTESDF